MNGSQIIAAGVGPIIVISACGLLCLAFYNRLAAVVTRLRSFHRERLHEQELLARERQSGNGDSISTVRHQEVIGMLSTQTRHVTRRAHLIRRTLFCLLLSIICLALCSLALGLSILWQWFVYLAVVGFVLGLLLLVGGMLFALVEMKLALDPIELEERFVTELATDFDDSTG